MHALKMSCLLQPSESYTHTYFNLWEQFRLHVCSFDQHETIAVFFWLCIKINKGFKHHKWKTILHHSVLLKKTMSVVVTQEILAGSQTRVKLLQSIGLRSINFFNLPLNMQICLNCVHMLINRSPVHGTVKMAGDYSTWHTSNEAVFSFLCNVAQNNVVRTERVWCSPVAYKIVNNFDLELSLRDAIAEVKDSLKCSQNHKSIFSNKTNNLQSFKLHKQSIAAMEFTDQWTTSYLRDIINQYEEKQKSYGLCYVVVKYPLTFLSSGISMRKQQELDTLGARDFSDAVLHSLSGEEREALMCQEKQRLRTYEIGWPHESYLPSAMMAEAGFYYLNDSDKVQCAFCRGVLHNWLPGDRPIEEHSKHFRNCSLVRGVPCGNITCNPDGEHLKQELLKNIKLTGSNTLTKTCAAVDLGINMQKASRPEYAAESSRIRSFGRFPITCPVPAMKICRAGFYYTGFDDTVKCFWCSGCLEKWEGSDDPWQEHEKNFPTCLFIKFSKEAGNFHYNDAAVGETRQSQSGPSQSARVGHTYYEGMIRYCENLGYSRADINEVIRKNRHDPFSNSKEMLKALHALEDNPSTSSPSPEINADTELPIGQTQCKSCRTNQASHIGLPCGCLILCSDCANQNRLHLVCQTCENKLNGLMKVYFG